MEDKKKFVKPEAELLEFSGADIITLSVTTLGGENWYEDDNTERWDS